MEELEVTITHNLDDLAERKALWDRKLIALDWGRKGSNPAMYTGAGRSQVELFHEMVQRGAAVVAAYNGATPKRCDRLVGYVRPGTAFEYMNGLLCLALAESSVVDASVSFVGNLPPRQCTVQKCHKRARGRLAALVHGRSCLRGFDALHHHDVECLISNYLTMSGLCECVWSGGRSYEAIDHAGSSKTGTELLVQTTVSLGLIEKKAAKLLELAQPGRSLYIFAPAAAESRCPKGVRFVSLETAFAFVDSSAPGRWLIDRMLSVRPQVSVDGG